MLGKGLNLNQIKKTALSFQSRTKLVC